MIICLHSLRIVRFEKTKTLTIWLTALLLFSGNMLTAQKPTRVKLLHANEWRHDKRLGPDVQRMIGNVIFQHDSTYLYCDSAYLHESTNSFDGFGNVRIKISDSLNIFSHLLDYNGNSKIAELTGNVRLIDSRATLTTEKLWYNRQTRIAWYLTGGKIVDQTNTLTSRRGYYYTDPEDAYFKDSVVLINPDYVVNSDTLKYNTESEIAWFFGPTTVTSEENLIYCEWGWYNTQTDKSEFSGNPYIITKNQKLSGDSLYYDRRLDFGIARQQVKLTDTVQNLIVKGNYGEFRRKKGSAFIVDSALAIMIDKHDSLYLHSDTLAIRFDTLHEKAEKMLAYYKAKLFRKDLQGMCDSLVYDFSDSTIFLYKDPVLWSEENQLTADTIHIALRGNQVDTMALTNSCFIISVDDSISGTYNQIKGKTVTGYFKDNQIVKVVVTGNSETIYFVREEDGSLIGVNKTISSDMLILLTNNEIESITYIRQPKGAVYPLRELNEKDLFLKDFRWIGDRRPLKREDVFIW
ncbi:MAG: hypothetical protein JXA03_11755 [Bacteroidales bacterium]|nr:hypothetical protein [Bacteroidales bacterium]